MMDLDDITGTIVDTALTIHRDLGPGLLESVYEAVLARLLERANLRVERQRLVRIEYEGLHFDEAFRADLFVEQQVLVEVKSLEKLGPVHGKQLLTYLRLMDLRVGLLVNFGAPTLKDGLHLRFGSEPKDDQPICPWLDQNGVTCISTGPDTWWRADAA